MSIERTTTARKGAGLRRRWRHSVTALLVLLGVIAPRASAQQGRTDTAFDQLIFLQDRTADVARTRLFSEVARHVNEIDRACRLTDAQKKKLHLAGRGDIQRFFERYETAKEQVKLGNGNGEKLNVAIDGDFLEIDREVLQVTSTLQIALRTGLFHEDSLLYKSLGRTLTNDQVERYEVLKEERRVTGHRAAIERAITRLGQSAPELAAKPGSLARFLADEIKPPRKPAPSPHDVYYVLYMMGRLPEDKLRRQFDAWKWPILKRQLDQYKRLGATLRQKGLLPDEDDDDAKPAPARR